MTNLSTRRLFSFIDVLDEGFGITSTKTKHTLDAKNNQIRKRNQMTTSTTYKTGAKAPTSGRYKFVRYTDGTTTPSPTSEERIIRLTRGEVFPPIRSCNKGAHWQSV
jgi:hypothetical protein